MKITLSNVQPFFSDGKVVFLMKKVLSGQATASSPPADLGEAASAAAAGRPIPCGTPADTRYCTAEGSDEQASGGAQ